MTVYFEKEWERDLTELRQELNIEPPPPIVWLLSPENLCFGEDSNQPTQLLRLDRIIKFCVWLLELVYLSVGVQRYTGKPWFTLFKYRIAIHFWLYWYTSLPYVSSSQYPSQICKKISIIGFEIARNSGRFQNQKG